MNNKFLPHIRIMATISASMMVDTDDPQDNKEPANAFGAYSLGEDFLNY